MEKKKSKLWKWIRVTLYILLGFPITVLLLLWLILELNSSDGEITCDDNMQSQQGGRCEEKRLDLERDDLARRIDSEIWKYYKQKGFYPKSLNDLSIAKTDYFAKYHKGIGYESGIHNNTPYYRLSWIYASPWNGMECSAGIKKSENSFGHNEHGNCYQIDHH